MGDTGIIWYTFIKYWCLGVINAQVWSHEIRLRGWAQGAAQGHRWCEGYYGTMVCVAFGGWTCGGWEACWLQSAHGRCWVFDDQDHCFDEIGEKCHCIYHDFWSFSVFDSICIPMDSFPSNQSEGFHWQQALAPLRHLQRQRPKHPPKELQLLAGWRSNHRLATKSIKMIAERFQLRNLRSLMWGVVYKLEINFWRVGSLMCGDGLWSHILLTFAGNSKT